MLTTFLVSAICAMHDDVQYKIFRVFAAAAADARHTLQADAETETESGDEASKRGSTLNSIFYDDDYSLIQLSSGDCGYCTTFKTRRTHLMRKWHTRMANTQCRRWHSIVHSFICSPISFSVSNQFFASFLLLLLLLAWLVTLRLRRDDGSVQTNKSPKEWKFNFSE